MRLASLRTLGYICADLDPEYVVDEVKNKIILALVNNCEVPPDGSSNDAMEACRLAITALVHAIPYAN